MSKLNLIAGIDIKLDPSTSTIHFKEFSLLLDKISNWPHNHIYCSHGNPHKYGWIDKVVTTNDALLLCQRPMLKDSPEKMNTILDVLTMIEELKPKEHMKVFHVKMLNMIYRPIIEIQNLQSDQDLNILIGRSYNDNAPCDKLLILGDSLGDLGYFE